MGLPPFRSRQWKQTAAQDDRRDIGAISNPRCGGARMRACTPRSQRGEPQSTKPHDAWADRSLHGASASPVHQCPNWRSAGSFCSNLIPLREVVQVRPRQVGASSVGETPGMRLRSSGSAVRHRGVATFLVALATKPEGPCAENRTLHLQRDEAYVQVRGEVGLSPREPDGKKTRRVTAWLYETLKTACTIDGAWFLFSVGPTWTARKASCGLCRMAWPARQRRIRATVAGFGHERKRGLVSARLRSGADHATKNRSLACEPPIARGSVGAAAPVALRHSLQSAGRLDLRFALHTRPASILARSVAQDSHQTGGARRWPSQHRVAQLSAHGERLGQGSGAGIGGSQDPSASREHRDDIRRIRRHGARREATNPTTDGRVRQAASVSRRFKAGSRLATKRACYHSLTLRDPYLTQILLSDFPEVQERNGSSGRTRTYNPPVNSRMLCH